MASGLYAAMVSPTFVACIELAANHDGDSASTASIAGQLYAARHGIKSIDIEVAYRLDVLDALLEVWGEWVSAGSKPTD